MWLWNCGNGTLVFKAKTFVMGVLIWAWRAADRRDCCFWHYRHHLLLVMLVCGRGCCLWIHPISSSAKPRLAGTIITDWFTDEGIAAWRNRLPKFTAQKQQSLTLELLMPLLLTTPELSHLLSGDITIDASAFWERHWHFLLQYCLYLTSQQPSCAELVKR